MLAVVKKPHIEISGEPIPEELLVFLKEHYRGIKIIEEDATDVTQTDWYQKMKNDSTPGVTMKRYRKRLKLSQAELAEKLGMVKQNISAMEKGNRGISKATANKLADIFQVSSGRFI